MSQSDPMQASDPEMSLKHVRYARTYAALTSKLTLTLETAPSAFTALPDWYRRHVAVAMDELDSHTRVLWESNPTSVNAVANSATLSVLDEVTSQFDIDVIAQPASASSSSASSSSSVPAAARGASLRRVSNRFGPDVAAAAAAAVADVDAASASEADRRDAALERRVRATITDGFRQCLSQRAAYLFRMVSTAVAAITLADGTPLSDRTRHVDSIGALWYIVCRECSFPHAQLTVANQHRTWPDEVMLHDRKMRVQLDFANVAWQSGETPRMFAERLMWFKHAYEHAGIEFSPVHAESAFVAHFRKRGGPSVLQSWQKACGDLVATLPAGERPTFIAKVERFENELTFYGIRLDGPAAQPARSTPAHHAASRSVQPAGDFVPVAHDYDYDLIASFAAMAVTDQQGRDRGACFACNKTGHMALQCPDARAKLSWLEGLIADRRLVLQRPVDASQKKGSEAIQQRSILRDGPRWQRSRSSSKERRPQSPAPTLQAHSPSPSARRQVSFTDRPAASVTSSVTPSGLGYTEMFYNGSDDEAPAHGDRSRAYNRMVTDAEERPPSAVPSSSSSAPSSSCSGATPRMRQPTLTQIVASIKGQRDLRAKRPLSAAINALMTSVGPGIEAAQARAADAGKRVRARTQSPPRSAVVSVRREGTRRIRERVTLGSEEKALRESAMSFRLQRRRSRLFASDDSSVQSSLHSPPQRQSAMPRRRSLAIAMGLLPDEEPKTVQEALDQMVASKKRREERRRAIEEQAAAKSSGTGALTGDHTDLVQHVGQRHTTLAAAPETLVTLDTGSCINLAKTDATLIDEKPTTPRTVYGAFDGSSYQMDTAGSRRMGSFTETDVYRHEQVNANLSSLQPHTDDHGRLAVFDRCAATILQPKDGVTIAQVHDAIKALTVPVVVYPRRGRFWTWSSNDEPPATMHARACTGELKAGTLENVYAMHVMLGHVDYAKLRILGSSGIKFFEPISFPWTPAAVRAAFPCRACAATKQRDIVHKPISSRVPASRPVEHFHIDVSGILRWSFENDNRQVRLVHRIFGSWCYYDVVVDGYSKYVWVHVTNSKTGEALTPWRMLLIKREERQRDAQLKRAFLDKGGENKDGTFVSFCEQLGIDLEWAPTANKQRQGQVERYMLILWGSAASMCWHANLHVVFAGHALLYAAYLLVRTPVAGEKRTRYEVHTGQVPHFKGTFTYGSDAILLNARPRASKSWRRINGTGEIAIFLGLSSESEYTHVFLLVSELPGEIVESTSFRIFDGKFTHGRNVYAQPRQANVMTYENAFDVNPMADTFASDENVEIEIDAKPAQSDDEDEEPVSPTDSDEDEPERPTLYRAASDALHAPVSGQSSSASGPDASASSASRPELPASAASAPMARPAPASSLPATGVSARTGTRLRRPADHGPMLSSANTGKRSKTQAVHDAVEESMCMSVQEARLHAEMVCDAVVRLVKPGPNSYREYMKLTADERAPWDGSMAKELKALIDKGVFEEVSEADLPAGIVPIDSRFVLVLKIDDKGDATFKARLVVKHIKGRFYGLELEPMSRDANYSPVVKTSLVRLIFILSALLGLRLHQIDINNAFLNATYKRANVFVRPPRGFVHAPGTLWRLLKPLYGMQDAPKEWFEEFKGFLLAQGFQPLHLLDECFFFRPCPSGSVVLLVVHVDDNIAAIPRDDEAQQWWASVVVAMNAKYGIKDLGVPTWCLGMNICVEQSGDVYLSQQTYIDKSLEKYALSDVHPVRFPEVHSVNSKLRGSIERMTPEQRDADRTHRLANDLTLERYQQYVGTLLYATLMTRPDIAHVVQLLSRDMAEERLTTAHFDAAVRVFRYLKATAHHGMHYAAARASSGTVVEPHVDAPPAPARSLRVSDVSLRLRCFTDADFAGDHMTSKSTGGYVIYLNGNLVHWQSKQQAYVVNSTASAEYIAMSHAATELIWYSEVLEALGFTVEKPMNVHNDNAATVINVSSEANSSRRRGLRVCYHHVIDEERNGTIRTDWISGKDNVADLLTKPVTEARFRELSHHLVAEAPH